MEWPIPFPSLCQLPDGPVVTANFSNKLPGIDSKRIALLMRGDSFRGLSYAIAQSKLPLYCSDAAYEIQRASVEAILEFIVKPFESHGYTVDVYVSTYGCTGLPQAFPAEKAVKWHNDLVAWYGKHADGSPRVVADELVQRVQGQTQSYGVQCAMRLLQSKAPLNYQSVMLWRYDIVPYRYMSDKDHKPPPVISQAPYEICDDESCFSDYLKYCKCTHTSHLSYC
jgi:hypothetical protein